MRGLMEIGQSRSYAGLLSGSLDEAGFGVVGLRYRENRERLFFDFSFFAKTAPGRRQLTASLPPVCLIPCPS